MRTLILTCNTGEGHNSCAAAISEYFALNGEFCEIADALGFLSKRISKIICKGHTSIYRHTPKVFDKGYALSENHSSVFSQGSIVYKILSRGTKRLHRYIISNDIDNIICVHPFSGMIVNDMCERYDLDVRTSIVATDYTCAPGTASCNFDTYFIPHEQIIADYVKCDIPRSKIVVSGIPVRQTFNCERNKIAAREKLQIPLDKNVIVMCCGSMGCGPIEKITQQLSAKLTDDDLLIIICGSNVSLYRKLTNKELENVKVIGYTRQMCEFMEACDVFMTKPGGISTSEASCIKVPMVFINAVAGCEQRNREFFEKINCAITGGSMEEIVDKTYSLLYNRPLQQHLSDNLVAQFTKNSAKCIYDTLVAYK